MPSCTVAWSNDVSALSNGVIVNGNVGVGISDPSEALQVQGWLGAAVYVRPIKCTEFQSTHGHLHCFQLECCLSLCVHCHTLSNRSKPCHCYNKDGSVGWCLTLLCFHWEYCHSLSLSMCGECNPTTCPTHKSHCHNQDGASGWR